MDDDLEAQNAAIQAMLGTASFGRQAGASTAEAQLNKSKRKVAEPLKKGIASNPENNHRQNSDDKDSDHEDEDDEDDDDDDDDEEDEFPVSHELVLKTHERAVTTVTLDSSGTRLITGSNDCTLKLHDFNGMTANTLKAFKSVDPSATKTAGTGETHPVRQATFNPLSPSQVLVVSALPQAKVFGRDGEELLEFVKGDMYLRDLNNTKGHVAEITCGAWHPTNPDLCVTAGIDSTLRIWDVNNKRSQKDVIVIRSKAAGSAGRTRLTAVAWGSPPSGGQANLISAALDGSLVVYSGGGPFHRPAAEVKDAHAKDTWTSGIDISRDGRMVVTRGGDNTIKLWDIRKLKLPVSTQNYPSMSSQYPTANIKYSPTSTNIIMGAEDGDLLILNPATLRTELKTPVTTGSPVITVLWHEKLNQIVTGSGNGETHVLYNPNISNGGAKLVMAKAPKKRHVDDDPNFTTDLSQGISADSIITPGGVLSNTARRPNTGLTASGKSRDPRRPHMPAVTPFAKSQPDAKHVKEFIPLSSMRDEDPREALLKYADKAKDDPMFTKAYRETQPKTIYADVSDEEEPDKKKQRR